MASTISDGVTTVLLDAVDGFEGSSEARTIAHTTFAGVAFTLRPAAPEAGVLTCVVESDAAAAQLYEIARTGSVLTLATDRAGVGMDFAVVEGEVTRALDDTRTVWVIEIPFQEVAP
ncbi:MAG TPA: hypothetical protein VL043_04590 [Protaetiibacter sp.]|nr:hypothetical protein [Protaetiibacter sp.]